MDGSIHQEEEEEEEEEEVEKEEEEEEEEEERIFLHTHSHTFPGEKQVCKKKKMYFLPLFFVRNICELIPFSSGAKKGLMMGGEGGKSSQVRSESTARENLCRFFFFFLSFSGAI